MPINEANFWSLAIVAFGERAIYYLEPVPANTGVRLPTLKLVDETLRSSFSGFTGAEAVRNLPLPPSFKDSGLYIIQYALSFCANRQLCMKFDESTVSQLRAQLDASLKSCLPQQTSTDEGNMDAVNNHNNNNSTNTAQGTSVENNTHAATTSNNIPAGCKQWQRSLVFHKINLLLCGCGLFCCILGVKIYSPPTTSRPATAPEPTLPEPEHTALLSDHDLADLYYIISHSKILSHSNTAPEPAVLVRTIL